MKHFSSKVRWKTNKRGFTHIYSQGSEVPDHGVNPIHHGPPQSWSVDFIALGEDVMSSTCLMDNPSYDCESSYRGYYALESKEPADLVRRDVVEWQAYEEVNEVRDHKASSNIR